MPGAAFFDLDKTLMAGSSGMVFARVANQRGFVTRGQLARWGWDHLRYRLRGSSDAQTNAVVDVAKKVFAEIPERDVERMAPAVLAGILPRIYPQMLDEVHRHQDEGRATFIVSAAGNDLVKALAAVLGMEGGIGTRWAIGTDGKYTGEMDGPFVYGEGKVEAMRRFAERHDIDMDASERAGGGCASRSSAASWRSRGPRCSLRPPAGRAPSPRGAARADGSAVFRAHFAASRVGADVQLADT
jgi:HAD superfamily hydrolase (TIGR01490 family)